MFITQTWCNAKLLLSVLAFLKSFDYKFRDKVFWAGFWTIPFDSFTYRSLFLKKLLLILRWKQNEEETISKCRTNYGAYVGDVLKTTVYIMKSFTSRLECHEPEPVCVCKPSLRLVYPQAGTLAS